MGRAEAFAELRRSARSITEARPGPTPAVIRKLAVGVDATGLEAAAQRLLERIAGRDDAAELRAALVELGALVVVHPLGPVLSPLAPAALGLSGLDRSKAS